jgi:small subunit ribosomal protein S17
MSEAKPQSSHRKERVGEVISDRFRKVITRYKKFYAHDEKNEAKVGDRVRIQETRPQSRLKSWRLIEVVERNRAALAAS